MSRVESAAPRLLAASDRSLLVSFGERISLDDHRRVRRLLRRLDASPLPGITNLVPAYSSLLVHFDPCRLRHREVEEHVRGLLDRGAGDDEAEEAEPRLVTIPVCYGGAFGPDLEEVARLRGLTPERVAELHAGVTYHVFCLGFVPGFAYLGELPEEIACPRLDTPRREVPAGSVGIAGAQTGIYPMATPGGWRLIGRTPLTMFDARRDPMPLLEIGDRVRFTPIPPERFTGAAA